MRVRDEADPHPRHREPLRRSGRRSRGTGYPEPARVAAARPVPCARPKVACARGRRSRLARPPHERPALHLRDAPRPEERALPRSRARSPAGVRPAPVRLAAMKAFARRYGIDLTECPDLEVYRTFGEFFARPLRPGLRPSRRATAVGLAGGRGRLGDRARRRGEARAGEGDRVLRRGAPRRRRARAPPRGRRRTRRSTSRRRTTTASTSRSPGG